MSKPVDLDEIEARANAATPGPWHGPHEDGLGCVHIGDYGWVAGSVTSGVYRYPHDGEDSEEGKADAEFIAHAREDVPALVAELRALRLKVRSVESAVAPPSNSCGTRWTDGAYNVWQCTRTPGHKGEHHDSWFGISEFPEAEAFDE